ncbi:MAG: hypothetical protein NTW46_02055 [Candidatus Nealsonbacteria bacterium]|nr:hypothetical protein [Candidatus Nealsonbacteria bacterium]
MQKILLMYLFTLLLCGCDLTQDDMVNCINDQKVSEGQLIPAEVVKVGEPLPQTNLVPTIVSLSQDHLIRVLAKEKLSVGQRVNLVMIYHRRTLEAASNESFYVVVIPKE